MKMMHLSEGPFVPSEELLPPNVRHVQLDQFVQSLRERASRSTGREAFTQEVLVQPPTPDPRTSRWTGFNIQLDAVDDVQVVQVKMDGSGWLCPWPFLQLDAKVFPFACEDMSGKSRPSVTFQHGILNPKRPGESFGGCLAHDNRETEPLRIRITGTRSITPEPCPVLDAEPWTTDPALVTVLRLGRAHSRKMFRYETIAFEALADPTLGQAWNTVENSSWMFWTASRLGIDQRRIVRALVACTRNAIRASNRLSRYRLDERPVGALKAAEHTCDVVSRWVSGEATLTEVQEARKTTEEFSNPYAAVVAPGEPWGATISPVPSPGHAAAQASACCASAAAGMADAAKHTDARGLACGVLSSVSNAMGAVADIEYGKKDSSRLQEWNDILKELHDIICESLPAKMIVDAALRHGDAPAWNG